MPRKKIIHLQVLPILSGVQNMMLQLLSGLSNDNYDIYVISSGNGPLVEAVESSGWKHITIKTLVRELSYKDFFTAWSLFWILRRIKPDIVHTHSSKTGFIGRLISKISRVPRIIHTIHGFPFHQYQPTIVRLFYTMLETFASFFADYNVFVNQFEREYAIHKLGFNKKRAITIYNGIVPLDITKAEPSNKDILSIVSVLRFSKQKNVLSTIEQAVKVVKQFDNVIFTFIGDGELYAECKAIIEKNNLEDRIILKGWISDVSIILKDYDVFLLNSLWEGLPISILEAMSVGLPIICSNIKGNNELVNSSNGWLVEPYDLCALEQVIAEILSNRDLLDLKGKESLIKVTNQFHYDLFISEYLRIYENNP